ncbi:MAG TPA: FAD-binding oxidoreductase [Terriglobales bacterium]|nr:FAD-binding oxidoreductase [Terriglobales bacterium]
MLTSSKHRSFWLEQCADDAPDQPQLRGSTRADTAILGGGYVGLWTALRIKEMQPSCDVVVLEQDICGGGASGRNGGFVLSWWPKLSSLAKLFGPEGAVRIGRSSESAIGEIGAFCAQYNIDADFRRGGWLWTATSNAQIGAWEGVLRICEKMSVEPFRRLDPAEVGRRSGSPAHRAGVFEASASIVQPAALVRGMCRIALEKGVRIYEATRALSFTRKSPITIRTEHGSLVADKLVIATNGWAASIRELNRSIAVISSDIVVTAPIPERLEQIGWHRDLSITDIQTMVDYYRISRDGRIAFGKGGWTIAYGGNIGANFDRHPRRAAEVTADLRRYYPMLGDVPVTHDWSGPIDRTPDSLPLLGYLNAEKTIAYGIGWSGNGVGPSVIGGKILASLALGQNDEWSNHPLVGRPLGNFPIAPIRYVGAHIVRTAVATKERAEIRDRKPPWWSVQLAKLAPAGLEDKSEASAR